MQDFIRNQLDNKFLYVPFLMAFGGALYFSITTEPNIPTPVIFTLIALCIAVFKHIPYTIRALAIFIFGFLYAYTFTSIINTAQINKTIRNQEITATVTNIEFTDNKTRLYLQTNASELNNSYNKNAFVRVSVTDDVKIPKIGDTIKTTVTLFRPNAAYAPETFDYARWSYFNKLSATGYASEISVLNELNYTANINLLRNHIHTKSESFLVDTLVLGFKNTLPENQRQIWTTTGIGHVWSISGFHMTLVGGWLFLIFYTIFRAIPYITRRIPARVPALICAWCGLAFYLFLSGLDVATIRAFLMTTMIFAAFIFGRNIISLRNICIVFCIIFLINPHYVMQAGFQLSFAAIFGIIWFWGDTKYTHRNKTQKIIHAIYATFITSVIAIIFTTPFIIAHFYSVPTYGLIGNMVLIPIFSFAIMPLVILGAITATVFNIQTPIEIAHKIYDFSINIATNIAKLPDANIIMPHMPNFALIIIIVGFVILMFIRDNKYKLNYVLFGICTICGTIITFNAPRPMFIASHDHELVAFNINGNLEFNKSRASNHYFAFDTWKQINSERTDTKNHRYKCPKGLCVYKTDKFKLAYIQKFVPLKNNLAKLCRDDDINYIISYFDIDAPHCNNKILREGFVIYDSGKITYLPQHRPWHNLRK